MVEEKRSDCWHLRLQLQGFYTVAIDSVERKTYLRFTQNIESRENCLEMKYSWLIGHLFFDWRYLPKQEILRLRWLMKDLAYLLFQKNNIHRQTNSWISAFLNFCFPLNQTVNCNSFLCLSVIRLDITRLKANLKTCIVHLHSPQSHLNKFT